MLRRLLPIGSLLALLALTGCGSETPSNPSVAGQAGMPAGGNGGVSSGGGGAAAGGEAMAGSGGAAGGSAGSAGAGGSAGSGGAAATGCVLSKTDADQPKLLSETGCIDMTDPTRPAPGLVPYSVRSALWSDGASKERFMRVPDGMKIHVLDCAVDVDACKEPGLGGSGEDDGHFQFPVGTVLIKNFSIDGKHIETRLLMKRTMTVWKGFSYEWDDAQTEANLLPDDADHALGLDKPVGNADQVWHFPSRSQCLECHTKFAGRSLGPSTQQLNSDFAYADGMANQLVKLEALGLFESAPKDMVGYPDPAGNGTLDERARSYMQTNCAICHRPGGEFSSVDMRFTAVFATSNLCGLSERDMGVVPKYRLVPGDPAKSAMSFRMHSLADTRMPKIGSKVVDTVGTQLIDDWITAMPTNACPPQP